MNILHNFNVNLQPILSYKKRELDIKNFSKINSILRKMFKNYNPILKIFKYSLNFEKKKF